MLPMTDAAVAALDGSRVRERVIVDAYLGDDLVQSDLPVDSWSLTWDATRPVQCSGTIRVTDPDGAMSPWALGDTLAPGARLQVTWVCEDGSRVPRALLVISQSTPESAWRIHHGGRVDRWVPDGGHVTCQVEDIMLLAQRDRLQAKQPAVEAKVISEVRRLLDRIVPVVDDSGGDETNVATQTVYERERLDAVDDLLEHAFLARRTDGSGVVHVIDPEQGDPVWDIAGGDRGALVTLGRSMDIKDITNSVVASSSGGSATEYVGRAYVTSGVDRWGGPLGNCTEFYSSPLITSQRAATQSATTRLSRITSERETELSISCAPHPGIELHDRVRVLVPTRGGDAVPVTGTVTSYTVGGDRAGLNAAQTTVVVRRSDLADVIRADQGDAS